MAIEHPKRHGATETVKQPDMAVEFFIFIRAHVLLFCVWLIFGRLILKMTFQSEAPLLEQLVAEDGQKNLHLCPRCNGAFGKPAAI